MKRNKMISWIALFIAIIPLTLQAQDMELLGAGATFPYPLYSKIFDVYHSLNSMKVNYQAIGSGGGVKQLLSQTVDFGASDAFLNENELAQSKTPILHIPICMGAVVLTYNLPGNSELKFSPDIIADIFLGKVTKWNDARLQSINPGIKLPSMDIVIVHRSDGSGTTFIFSDYLSKVSSDWQKKVGAGKALNWPAGLGAKGNPGVAGMIKQLPGSIGYVELIYALENKMPIGSIKNSSGQFIQPTIQSVSLAANTDIPADTRVSLTNTTAKEGYPISGLTWILLYQEQNYNNRSAQRATNLANLLWWMVHEGQQYAQPLHYAPLPEKMVKLTETILKTLTYQKKPLL